MLTDEALRKRVKEDMKREFEGRFERLKFLMETDYHGAIVSRVPLYWFVEEARSCWYHGNYIATIIMCQMALEEQLRSHFRVAGVSRLVTGKRPSLDAASFADLIEEALHFRYIDKEEAELLHHLRKDLRNVYVHIKDQDVRVVLNDQKEPRETSLPSFFVLDMKIRELPLVQGSVKEDAKEAIEILIFVFTNVMLRGHGF